MSFLIENLFRLEFMFFFGFFYLILTTVVLFFIKEKHEEHIKSKNFKILGTYKLLWDMAKLKPIQWFIVLFLTIRVSVLGYSLLLFRFPVECFFFHFRSVSELTPCVSTY